MYPKLDSKNEFMSVSIKSPVRAVWEATNLHGKQDVDQQVTSAASNQESSGRRKDNGDENENNV